MKIKITLLSALCLTPLLVFATDLSVENTDKNVRDSFGETLTPIDQSNDPFDLEITAKTRKMLINDHSLSTNAKNCKIITTQGGMVTLRGPVDSEAEKLTIVHHANMAGAKAINNQLEVKTTHNP